MKIKRILKVKFCQNEEELNKFLENFPLEEYEEGEKVISKLHRVTYLPKQVANGDSSKFEISSSVISIVEYWDYAVQQ